jgi:hypothetical protein
MSSDRDNFSSEFEKLRASKFKQQKLPAWRPVPTITSTTLTFLFFGLAFITIGIIVLVFSNDIYENSFRYDDKSSCELGSKCNVTVNVEQDMKLPVMVYYQLNNFYQNHRRYVKSKSNDQLLGKNVSLSTLQDECSPIVYMKDIGIYESIDKTSLDPDTIANPCGLIAKSFFNDTYKFVDDGLIIDENGIAWQADIDLKYAHPPNYEKIQWLNTTNEHFMVWMRPAGLPNFRKLWGRIKTYKSGDTLPKGNYTLEINNIYPVSEFKGEKYFVISTVNSFGGKNSFLGIAYIVVGSLCIVMAIVFFIGYKIHNKKKDN